VPLRNYTLTVLQTTAITVFYPNNIKTILPLQKLAHLLFDFGLTPDTLSMQLLMIVKKQVFNGHTVFSS